MPDQQKLQELYNRLYDSYGPQHWWPAETAFEVMVGAVLTQNTAWKNVEMAIENLREAGYLNLLTISRLDVDELADHIYSCGYYNLKARRLQNLCDWLLEAGGIDSLSDVATCELRQALLSINGIGPETADDILLYALHRPVFVIDSYTRRLLIRLNLITGDETYEVLRKGFESALGEDTVLFNEYHALIVRHAKQKCSSSALMPGIFCKHCYVESGDTIAQAAET